MAVNVVPVVDAITMTVSHLHQCIHGAAICDESSGDKLPITTTSELCYINHSQF